MNKIIIVLPNSKLTNLIAQVGRGLGHPVAIFDKLENIKESDLEGAKILFSTFETVDYIDQNMDQSDIDQTCLFGGVADFEKFLQSSTQSNINFYQFDQISESCAEDIAILLRKISDKNFFGIDKYLGYAATIYKAPVFDKQTKTGVIERVYEWIENLSLPGLEALFQDYAAQTAESLDELLLNAIFHANPRLNENSLDSSYILSENESIQVTWGCDGRYIGISVMDPFGSLTREMIVQSLSKAAGNTLMHRTAGRGLQSVFKYNNKVIVNVNQNQKTEFITLRNLAMGIRDKARLKTFHFFSKISQL